MDLGPGDADLAEGAGSRRWVDLVERWGGDDAAGEPGWRGEHGGGVSVVGHTKSLTASHRSSETMQEEGSIVMEGSGGWRGRATTYSCFILAHLQIQPVNDGEHRVTDG